MLPFYVSPPTTAICPTRWIGKKQEVTGQMKTTEMLRKQSVVLALDNVCPAKRSEGKRAYVDRVIDLKKAAIDASDRVETYLLAVKAANKSPSWELPEGTELFKLMHNKYMLRLSGCLGILVLESCRGGIKIICGRVGIKNLGSKVTTATTAPLQAMPPEVPQKEWKNISMG